VFGEKSGKALHPSMVTRVKLVPCKSICTDQFVNRLSRTADGFNHSFYSGNPMKGEHHDAGSKR